LVNHKMALAPMTSIVWKDLSTGQYYCSLFIFDQSGQYINEYMYHYSYTPDREAPIFGLSSYGDWHRTLIREIKK